MWIIRTGPPALPRGAPADRVARVGGSRDPPTGLPDGYRATAPPNATAMRPPSGLETPVSKSHSLSLFIFYPPKARTPMARSSCPGGTPRRIVTRLPSRSRGDC
ncbi:hypothetical protein Acsp05_44310 [Actinokineospora sp. NBRC 105648]|nr:hypothetical protein Acsp05_44310 [Actinokineospora sp. NBRC 105648]